MAVLESRLVIAAVDETEKAFASVEGRIKRLTTAVGSSSRAVGGSASTVAAASAQTGGSAVSEMAGTAAVVGGMAVAVAASEGARAAGKAIAARQHEAVRMDTAGMDPKEIAEATLQASKLTAEMPAVSMTDTMHMLRNARSIVGSYAEAAEIAKPMIKLRVLAQLAKPGTDVTEDFDSLIKGLEIKGVTQDPKKFTEYMQGVAKGINVFGDTLKPVQYYEMFKYGRQATQGLSEKFILSTAPTLAQELGGSSYGKAVSAFNAAIVGGVMKTKAVDEYYRLGLLGDSDVKTLKSGEKQILAGKNVAGWQQAQSDPNAWVRETLLPALASKGITEKSDVLREISVLFQNQMAGQMVGLLATQQSRVDKDAKLLTGAPGLEAADKAMQKDPGLGWEALKNAAAGLVGTVGQSVEVASAMTTAAQAMGRFAEAIETEKKAQDEGKPSPATAETNAHLNNLVAAVVAVPGDAASDLAQAKHAADIHNVVEQAGHLQKLIDAGEGRATADQSEFTVRGAVANLAANRAQMEQLRQRAIQLRDEGKPPAADLAAAGAVVAPSGFAAPARPMSRTPASAYGGISGASSIDVGAALRALPAAPSGPSSVAVAGAASVEQSLHIDISLDPGLRAALDAAKNLNFSVPLTGADTGRMDAAAAPNRTHGAH